MLKYLLIVGLLFIAVGTYLYVHKPCPPTEILPFPKGVTVVCYQYYSKHDLDRRLECYDQRGEFFNTYRPMGGAI